jgi:hypothetical protein
VGEPELAPVQGLEQDNLRPAANYPSKDLVVAEQDNWRPAAN